MRVAVLACGALALSIAAADAQRAESAQSPQAASHGSASGGFPFSSRKCDGAINVASDSFEGDFQTKVGTYRGNVIVTQADCKLRADKVVAEAASGKNLDRLTATGNVVFNSSSGTATGDNGIYDLGPKTITLTGRVVLTKGKDVMRGTHLVVDLNTGLAHLTAKGMAGGRVQSSFVPERQESDKPSKPSVDGEN